MMSKDTITGNYVSSAPELNGIFGKYFEKSNKYESLNFDKEYKQKLWEQTEILLSRV